jgi:hypothetical protein
MERDWKAFAERGVRTLLAEGKWTDYDIIMTVSVGVGRKLATETLERVKKELELQK